MVLSAWPIPACEPVPTAPPPRIERPREPHWEPLFNPPPDLVLVVRPQAVLGDEAYGPVLRRAFDVARQQSRLVAAAGPLQVLEDAEEVLIAARDHRGRDEADLVVVLRGVGAAIDPLHVTDDVGHPMWIVAPNRPAPDVRELWRAPADAGADRSPEPDAQDSSDTSLFELPGRTWVIAVGDARSRAREVFVRGDVGPAPSGSGDDAAVLAELRMRGSSLVARVRALEPPALLSPIGRSLAMLTVALPAKGGALIHATLSYSDDAAVSPAGDTLRQALDALAGASGAKETPGGDAGSPAGASQASRGNYAWLRGAKVVAAPRSLEVTVPLPPRVTAAPDAGPASPAPRDADPPKPERRRGG